MYHYFDLVCFNCAFVMFQALTFEELQYLHKKTIDATSKMMDVKPKQKEDDIVRKQQEALTQGI